MLLAAVAIGLVASEKAGLTLTDMIDVVRKLFNSMGIDDARQIIAFGDEPGLAAKICLLYTSDAADE